MAKKNKIALANALIWLHQRLFPRLRPAAALNVHSTFGCIVIYSTTALGDVMFNTPAIRQLRRRFPAAHLILVAHQKYTDMLQGYADVDEVLCWDGRFARLPAFVRQLRTRQPELAVILHSRAPYDVFSAVLAGCHTIVRDDNLSGEEVPMTQWLAAWSPPDFVGHVIQRKLKLLSVLGTDPSATAMVVPCIVNRQRYRRTGQCRVGFQLGASTAERRWPVSHFVALADCLLTANPAIVIVLLGIDAEVFLADDFMVGLASVYHGRVESLVGKTSVSEAFDAVASLDVLVTGDTGPLHLAIALQVPTVSLFASANPDRTGPYQDPDLHQLIRLTAQDAVMADITPQQVFDCCVASLSARSVRKESVKP